MVGRADVLRCAESMAAERRQKAHAPTLLAVLRSLRRYTPQLHPAPQHDAQARDQAESALHVAQRSHKTEHMFHPSEAGAKPMLLQTG
jgi:hypothetical protein